MENKNQSTDLRVIKTKRAIRKAFAELLSKKEIDNITVKDIAECAMINRKTFYNYYHGIYQVFDEIEDEVVNAFDSAVKNIDFSKALQDPYEIFEKLTAIVKNDIDFYGALLKVDRNTKLVSKIAALLKIKAKEVLSNRLNLDDEKISVMADYAVSGLLSVYQSWFNSNGNQSIEEVSEIAGRMCFTGIAGVINSLSEKNNAEKSSKVQKV